MKISDFVGKKIKEIHAEAPCGVYGAFLIVFEDDSKVYIATENSEEIFFDIEGKNTENDIIPLSSREFWNKLGN